MAICGRVIILVAALGVAVPPALAQDIFMYPAQGQSQQQQDRDRYECHSWATQQTGFDPSRAGSAAPAPQPPVQQGSDGSMMRGAARGAALGAVGGAIGGNAGTGAAIGGATGALIGGFRRQDQRRQQAAQQQQQSAAAANQNSATATQRNNYNRAMAACLSGRGYTVN